MKRNLLATIAFFLLIAPALPQAQSPADHQQHHPAGDSSAAPSQPSATPPTAPAQPPAVTVLARRPGSTACRGAAAGPNPHGRNDAGDARAVPGDDAKHAGGLQGHYAGRHDATGYDARQAASQSEATNAYMAAMERMNGPMMQGVQDSDPDVAFVKGMIPHHQGAIEMAKVALQHGKDEQTKKWANDIVREQQREVAEMQEWLKKRGK